MAKINWLVDMCEPITQQHATFIDQQISNCKKKISFINFS